MLQYILNVTSIWLMSLLLFDLFLRRESYHGYNRFYLLFTFCMGLLLPLPQVLSAAWADNFLLRGNTGRWVATAWIAGAAVAFGLLAVDVARLVWLYSRGTRAKQEGWTIVETGREHPPFSYLDILFVAARSQYSPGEWEMILTHEGRHSTLLHVIDMLLMQLARIVFWFHPLVYIYGARLLMVHEYQADVATSKEPDMYGRFLLEQSVLKAAPAFSHSFNRSPIKKRIMMLAKNAKPRTGLGNLKLLLILPLTLVCLLFFSKKSYSINPPGEVWKRQVIRVIDFTPPQEDDKVPHQLSNAEPDSLLLEMFMSAIYKGKLTAYSNFDSRFTTKLDTNELTQMLVPRPDTVMITDPTTGQELTKVIRHDFDCSLVHKYRILEEWTYSERTHKTEIEILGVAPVKEIYDEGGRFRGQQAIFWLKYKDIQPILARYELYHPNNTLESRIWEDNFKGGEIKSDGH